MSEPKNFTDKIRSTGSDNDEEGVLMDVSEDRRLLRLGIDPDSDPITILLATEKNLAELEKERLEEKDRKALEKVEKKS